MKKILNFYLDNHFLDFVISGLIIFVLAKFDLYQKVDIDNKSDFLSSLIGVSSAIWGFGALSATILVSIAPNDIFEELKIKLGSQILKKIFTSLFYIFLTIILFLILSINPIQKFDIIEMAIFILAFTFLLGNTTRFTIILYNILKINIG